MGAASRRRGCIDLRSRRLRPRSRRARGSLSASSSISGLTDLPYDVPNIRAENGPADAHVRIGWFRAVSNNFHAFAAHSFADEMAQAAGRDSLEFLLDMLGPGQGARSQGAGRRLLELRRAVRQIPDRHAPAAPRARDRGREVGMGQEEAGERLGHGHRRASQLQHLRGLGRRGRGGREGRREGAAHRSGRRRRRDRQSRSRPFPDGRRGGHGGRPGAHRRDHRGSADGSSRATSTTSRWRA